GIPLSDPTDFLAVPGKGTQARMDGHTIRVGNLRFLQEEGVKTDKGAERAKEFEQEGKTVVAVAADQGLLGLITVSDTLKADAVETIRQVKAAGLQPVMLTGDNQRTARAVARQVGIEDVLAEVVPDEKAAQIRRLQAEGHRVVMVGDGINDAPALMQADVGIAIGAGTDIAIESADIILVGDRLGALMEAYSIGRNSYKKTVQNLSLAFTFNGIGVPLAATGIVHPVWAMIAMVASVTTVLLNSFGGRFLPQKKTKPALAKQHLTLELPTMHCEGSVGRLTDVFAPSRLRSNAILEQWRSRRIYRTIVWR
ncbi:MAG: HAD family hydrolase, partial [Calditrichaeota bacterium]